MSSLSLQSPGPACPAASWLPVASVPAGGSLKSQPKHAQQSAALQHARQEPLRVPAPRFPGYSGPSSLKYVQFRTLRCPVPNGWSLPHLSSCDGYWISIKALATNGALTDGLDLSTFKTFSLGRHQPRFFFLFLLPAFLFSLSHCVTNRSAFSTSLGRPPASDSSASICNKNGKCLPWTLIMTKECKAPASATTQLPVQATLPAPDLAHWRINSAPFLPDGQRQPKTGFWVWGAGGLDAWYCTGAWAWVRTRCPMLDGNPSTRHANACDGAVAGSGLLWTLAASSQG
ncbi:hypothetical protein FALBO_16451 [Fusarium albosuccineum]|uniref:Uncharacterized protein n=1 Tax=Fusarium albosuccineum TaxID=1237068 RepID=A0A8H4KFY4_9HYPO|nr:hypothetical protein FALBO_16451 [Fusarium albosuccineum]